MSQGQPKVVSCSTSSADPRAVPVPMALVALILCVYLPFLKVWPDPQVEEHEASGLKLKVPIIFLENLCSLCSGYGRLVVKWPFIWRFQVSVNGWSSQAV